MTDEERQARFRHVFEERAKTALRHSQMVPKAFETKIIENKLTKEQKEALERLFLEAKWYKNYVLD